MSKKPTDEEKKRIDMLIDQLSDRNLSVRRAAGRALIEMKDLLDLFLPKLHKLARSENIAARIAVADTCRFLHKKVLPLILELMNDSDPSVRSNAIRALKFNRSNIKEAIPALIEKLQDETSIVRYSAVDTLGRYGTKAEDAIPKLLPLLRDDNHDLAYNTAIALIKIGGKNKSLTGQLKNEFLQLKAPNTQFFYSIVLLQYEAIDSETIEKIIERGGVNENYISRYNRFIQSLSLNKDVRLLNKTIKSLSIDKPITKEAKKELVNATKTMGEKIDLLMERAIDEQLSKEELLPIDQISQLVSMGKTRVETVSTLEEINFRKAQTELAILEAQHKTAVAEASKAEKLIDLELKRAELDIKRSNMQRFLLENLIGILNMFLVFGLGILVAVLECKKT